MATKLAKLKSAVEQEACKVENMTTDNIVQFQVNLSDDQSGATVCTIAEIHRF